jgi:hypothetical protein
MVAKNIQTAKIEIKSKSEVRKKPNAP